MLKNLSNKNSQLKFLAKKKLESRKYRSNQKDSESLEVKGLFSLRMQQSNSEETRPLLESQSTWTKEKSKKNLRWKAGSLPVWLPVEGN